MALGLRVIGAAFAGVFSRFALSLAANVTAIVLSIPLILVILVLSLIAGSLSIVPLGIAVFVGVLPNPASTGLQLLMRESAHGETPELRDQRRGLHDYWRRALKAWLVSAGVTAILVANVAFYAHQAADSTSSFQGIAGPISVFWSVLLICWLAIHLYVAPLLMAQTVPGLFLTYRNAMTLTMSRLITSWTVIVIWLTLLVLTSATGLATVIGLALGAALQQNALRLVLPTFSELSSEDALHAK